MSNELWTAVDDYIANRLIPADRALDAALDSSAEAGLPPISVSAPHGKLLHMLALIRGAKNILEIGTLGGYSSIWLARALPPDGKLITIEANPDHARVAQANIARAKLDNVVEVRLGLAGDLLPKIAAEKREPFDLTFIDADKESNADYFQWALKMSKRGSLIVVDNVIRGGAVIDETSRDSMVQGVRRLNNLVAAETRVSATEIQTVGSKGYDGFMLALVTADI